MAYLRGRPWNLTLKIVQDLNKNLSNLCLNRTISELIRMKLDTLTKQQKQVVKTDRMKLEGAQRFMEIIAKNSLVVLQNGMRQNGEVGIFLLRKATCRKLT
nr:hypothetical protein Itr_chr01CG17110 [Ipomoea trifida]GMC47585.1 hypothetical protein Iba_chr01aCG12730 [Ipomoea batatas]